MPVFKHSIGPIHRIDSRVIISNKVIFGIIFLCTTCYWIPPSLFAQALGQKVEKPELVQALQVFFMQVELKTGKACHGYI